MAAQISRARQRANARQAIKLGPTGYTARRLAAVAAGVFAGGIAIGVTAGLLVGGGPQSSSEPPARQAAESTGPEAVPEATVHPVAPERTASINAPTGDGPRPAVAPARPAERGSAPSPADAPAVDLTRSLEITEEIVNAGRGQAIAPRPEASATAGESLPAWRRNAAAYAAPGPETPRIAIVIDDLGLNRPNSREVLRLQGPLTLAFMTYAPSPGDLPRAARAAGHELLVHVPMQPSDDTTDPGPKVLSGGLARSELLARLEWGLARFDGYVGINNHMGSAFTRDAEGMRTVLGELKRRGLLFLDSRTIGSSVAASLAGEMGVAHATRDVFLDNQRDVAAIRAQLEKAERIARETGSAVAIGHPYDETIEALRAWLPTLPAKQIALVPISALAEGRGPDVARLPGPGAE